MRRPCFSRWTWLPVTLVALTLPPLIAAGGSLTARVTPPNPDGTLELTIEAPRAPMAEPDLTGLEQRFEVLGSRTQTQSFMVNGRRSDSFSLILTLRPRHEGVVEIPPISYGEETTPPLHLSAATPPQSSTGLPPAPVQAQPERPQTVTGDASALVLEADLAPDTVRVQQQAILRARVMAPVSRSATLAQPRLSEPKVSGASLIPLGANNYRADRAGEPFEIYERRFAIFPTRPGILTIEPLTADAWAGGPGVTAPVQHRADSQGLTLRVEPALTEAGRAWLPAGAVSLSEDQSGLVRIRPGETWPRDIVLKVAGQPAGALPQITAAAPFQLAVQYAQPARWDERGAEGLVGNRRERILISGNEPGLYHLPEVRLDWWNTATGAWDTATLPGRDLQILASAAPLPSAITTDQPQADPGMGTADLPAAGTTSSPTDASETPGVPAKTGDRLWIWALLALVLAWLAVPPLRQLPGRLLGEALGRLSAPRRRPAVPTTQAEAPAARPDPMAEAIGKVRDAYQKANPEAARLALLAWARLAWRHDPPGNLTQLALRCPEPARGRITLLDQAFFSPDPLDWTREPLPDDLPAISAVAVQEPPPAPPKRRLGPRPSGKA